MKTKFWIRLVVFTALLAWPGVETYRFWVSTQELAKAQALERSVTAKLQAARAKHVQVADADNTSAAPATSTTTKH